MAKGSKKKRAHSEEAIAPAANTASDAPEKLSGKDYDREMFKLQAELVKLQEWAKHTGARVVIIFEGRDAAGKGGVIKRIAERTSPRVFRVVALPAPTERQKSQMYMQRYVEHMPSGGEIIIFDRSWYNRAGVEHVMGFCTKDQYTKFLKQCPSFEMALVSDGIILLKYWMEVSEKEQHKRFQARIKDTSKRWKLSPMDLESHRRWYDYSRARDAMLAATDIPQAPWYVVPSDDKKRARLNCIADILSRIPYEEIPYKAPKLPPRQKPKGYEEPKIRHQEVAQRY
jgi:polyphosphate kinase 2